MATKTEAHSLSLADKDKLLGMLNALEHFNRLDKDMPLQMIRTMLLLCVEDGVGPHKVAEELGVAGAVASRHISDLGEMNRYKHAGHNLVEQRVDVLDRRYRKAWLTAKGLAFRSSLLRALRG